jgi:hypothetical protein
MLLPPIYIWVLDSLNLCRTVICHGSRSAGAFSDWYSVLLLQGLVERKVVAVSV